MARANCRPGLPLVHVSARIYPLFADYQPPAKNILTASIVLAVMILPIITAVAREVFLQTPAFMKKQPLRLVQHGGKSSRWPCSPLAAPG